MPNENPLAQAMNVAEKAVEVLEAVPSKRSAALKRWGTILGAVTTFITAAGALWQTFAHWTGQRNTYNALSADITKLSEAEQKDQEDLAKLQEHLDKLNGYLEGLAAGLARAPLPAGPSPALAPDAASPASPDMGAKPSKPSKPLAGAGVAGAQDAGASVPFSLQVPPVPTLHKASAPVNPVSFDSAAQGLK